MRFGTTPTSRDDVIVQIPRCTKNSSPIFCTTLVLPVVHDDWKIVEFNAYFPLANMVCGHMLMPILLNPGLMLVFY